MSQINNFHCDENSGYVYMKACESKLQHVYLIYFHGIYGDATKAISRMKNINCHKIFIEYPGYSFLSRSKKLSVKILHKDTIKILDDVFEFIPSGSSIIMHGRSIGTGVMCPYINNYIHRIDGIILETPFITLENIIYTYMGITNSWLNYILQFDVWGLGTLKHIEEVAKKILIVAYGQDYVTPVSHSKLLFEKLKNSPDIELIILENESHTTSFSKIEKDVIYWVENFNDDGICKFKNEKIN